jgi:hypothetical protein
VAHAICVIHGEEAPICPGIYPVELFREEPKHRYITKVSEVKPETSRATPNVIEGPSLVFDHNVIGSFSPAIAEVLFTEGRPSFESIRKVRIDHVVPINLEFVWERPARMMAVCPNPGRRFCHFKRSTLIRFTGAFSLMRISRSSS